MRIRILGRRILDSAALCATRGRAGWEANQMIHTKRVYEAADPQDGARFLVERLWPRGLKKAALPLDGWIKEAAPSSALRLWFGHDPQRWAEFKRRYFAELDQAPDAWAPLLTAARRGPITLLYSARDTEHNNAVALQEYLAWVLAPAPDHDAAARPDRAAVHRREYEHL